MPVIWIILLIPISLFSLQKAPEVYETQRIFNSRVVEPATGVVYLEGSPIITESENRDILTLVPIFKHNKVNRIVEVQMLMTFYPNMDKFSTNIDGTLYIEPNLISFNQFHSIKMSSYKREIVLPIIRLQNNIEDSPEENIYQAQTSGNIYIFPDKITNIIKIVNDTMSSQEIPTVSNQTDKPTFYQGFKKEPMFNPRTYSIIEIFNLYSLSTTKNRVNYIANPSSTFNDISTENQIYRPSPPPNTFQINLISDNKQYTFTVSSYYIGVLNRMLEYYKSVS